MNDITSLENSKNNMEANMNTQRDDVTASTTTTDTSSLQNALAKLNLSDKNGINGLLSLSQSTDAKKDAKLDAKRENGKLASHINAKDIEQTCVVLEKLTIGQAKDEGEDQVRDTDEGETHGRDSDDGVAPNRACDEKREAADDACVSSRDNSVLPAADTTGDDVSDASEPAHTVNADQSTTETPTEDGVVSDVATELPDDVAKIATDLAKLAVGKDVASARLEEKSEGDTSAAIKDEEKPEVDEEVYADDEGFSQQRDFPRRDDVTELEKPAVIELQAVVDDDDVTAGGQSKVTERLEGRGPIMGIPSQITASFDYNSLDNLYHPVDPVQYQTGPIQLQPVSGDDARFQVAPPVVLGGKRKPTSRQVHVEKYVKPTAGLPVENDDDDAIINEVLALTEAQYGTSTGDVLHGISTSTHLLQQQQQQQQQQFNATSQDAPILLNALTGSASSCMQSPKSPPQATQFYQAPATGASFNVSSQQHLIAHSNTTQFNATSQFAVPQAPSTTTQFAQPMSSNAPQLAPSTTTAASAQSLLTNTPPHVPQHCYGPTDELPPNRFNEPNATLFGNEEEDLLAFLDDTDPFSPTAEFDQSQASMVPPTAASTNQQLGNQVTAEYINPPSNQSAQGSTTGSQGSTSGSHVSSGTRSTVGTFVPSPATSYASAASPYADVFGPNFSDPISVMLSPDSSVFSPQSDLETQCDLEQAEATWTLIGEFIEEDVGTNKVRTEPVPTSGYSKTIIPPVPTSGYSKTIIPPPTPPQNSSSSENSRSSSEALSPADCMRTSPPPTLSKSARVPSPEVATAPPPQQQQQREKLTTVGQEVKEKLRQQLMAKQNINNKDGGSGGGQASTNQNKDKSSRAGRPSNKNRADGGGGAQKSSGSKAGDDWKKKYRDNIKSLPPILPKPEVTASTSAAGAGATAVTKAQSKIPSAQAALAAARASNRVITDPAEREKMAKERAQMIAYAKVAKIPLAKLREVDQDGDSILHNLTDEDWLDGLTETLVARVDCDDVDDADDLSPLSMSILKGIHIVKAVLERMKREGIVDDLINNINKEGQTPLLLSCYCSDPIIAQMLLEANADPNREVYRYHNNVQRFFTPLHFLCEKGQSKLDILNVLLAHGKTDINKTNSNMETPLHVAIRRHGTACEPSGSSGGGGGGGGAKKPHETCIDSRETVRLLLQRKAQFKAGPNDQNPLHYLGNVGFGAKPEEFLDFMKYVMTLIEDAKVKQSLVNANSDRGTVLHIVAAKKFQNDKEKAVILDTLRYLITECGANPTLKDKTDFPIKRYVHKQDKEISDYLTHENRRAKRQLNIKNHRNQSQQRKQEEQEFLFPDIDGLTDDDASSPDGSLFADPFLDAAAAAALPQPAAPPAEEVVTTTAGSFGVVNPGLGHNHSGYITQQQQQQQQHVSGMSYQHQQSPMSHMTSMGAPAMASMGAPAMTSVGAPAMTAACGGYTSAAPCYVQQSPISESQDITTLLQQPQMVINQNVQRVSRPFDQAANISTLGFPQQQPHKLQQQPYNRMTQHKSIQPHNAAPITTAQQLQPSPLRQLYATVANTVQTATQAQPMLMSSAPQNVASGSQLSTQQHLFHHQMTPQAPAPITTADFNAITTSSISNVNQNMGTIMAPNFHMAPQITPRTHIIAQPGQNGGACSAGAF